MFLTRYEQVKVGKVYIFGETEVEVIKESVLKGKFVCKNKEDKVSIVWWQCLKHASKSITMFIHKNDETAKQFEEENLISNKVKATMKTDEIKKYLCIFDKRHPYYKDGTKSETEVCTCDNCYYERSDLAEEALRLTECLNNKLMESVEE